MSTPCAVEDCAKPISQYGFCKLHASRWIRHGDPQYYHHDIERRWGRYVDETLPAEECWPFMGHREIHGYGRLKVGDKYVLAHRFSYERRFGPIPDGYDICHRCDNPPCVNPDHLFAGTAQDNMSDAVLKGRMASGERCGTARLNSQRVVEIRELFSTGALSIRAIGRRFGVSHRTVAAVIHGESWRCVGMPASQPPASRKGAH